MIRWQNTHFLGFEELGLAAARLRSGDLLLASMMHDEDDVPVIHRSWQ
jgi:hypothetical protein